MPGPILLFDVMDTLVYDPFATELPAFFGLTFEEMLAAKHPSAWVDFELGALDETAFHERFFADGRTYDAGALRACLRAAYRFVDGVEPILEELRAAGAPMHALSNYTPWYALIEEAVGLSRYVPWTFVSCVTRVRKPDPEAYLGAARVLGVTPEACVFVDDRARNCDAARAVGMRAFVFRGANALRGDLAAIGVLPEVQD